MTYGHHDLGTESAQWGDTVTIILFLSILLGMSWTILVYIIPERKKHKRKQKSYFAHFVFKTQ